MKTSRKPSKSVKLKTKGDLSLYFVGCGSAFAKTLNQNNLLITKGDHHLLVDCGTRCAETLREVVYAEADEEGKLALSQAWEAGREKREANK